MKRIKESEQKSQQTCSEFLRELQEKWKPNQEKTAPNTLTHCILNGNRWQIMFPIQRLKPLCQMSGCHSPPARKDDHPLIFSWEMSCARNVCLVMSASCVFVCSLLSPRRSPLHSNLLNSNWGSSELFLKITLISLMSQTACLNFVFLKHPPNKFGYHLCPFWAKKKNKKKTRKTKYSCMDIFVLETRWRDSTLFLCLCFSFWCVEKSVLHLLFYTPRPRLHQK